MMPTESIEFSFELMIWAVLGVILMVCVISVTAYNLNSNKFQALNSTAYYISQNVNIAASRNVQVYIKLPDKIAGTTYNVCIYRKNVILSMDETETSKQTLFPMVTTTLTPGKSYILIPQAGIVLFQEE